jgi:hypothetical protein
MASDTASRKVGLKIYTRIIQSALDHPNNEYVVFIGEVTANRISTLDPKWKLVKMGLTVLSFALKLTNIDTVKHFVANNASHFAVPKRMDSGIKIMMKACQERRNAFCEEAFIRHPVVFSAAWKRALATASGGDLKLMEATTVNPNVHTLSAHTKKQEKKRLAKEAEETEERADEQSRAAFRAYMDELDEICMNCDFIQEMSRRPSVWDTVPFEDLWSNEN